MKIPIKNIYFLLMYAWDCLDEAHERDLNGIAGRSWTNLAARLLLGWVERQRRRGIDRGYLDFVETTSTIRGKVLLTPTLRYQELRRGRTVCTVNELNVDTALNRAVKATLTELLKSPDVHKDLADELLSARTVFASVTDCRLTEHLCHYAQTCSNNRSYQLPLSIGRLIAMQLMASEADGQFRIMDFERDDGPMARLFESFVRNLLRRDQKAFDVRSRVMEWQVEDITNTGRALLPRMRTDVSLEGRIAHGIIETKYYAKPFATYQESEKWRAYHLYQLSAYLEAHRMTHPAHGPAAGVLLYAQPRSAAFDEEFQLKSHPIRVLTIDLSDDWAAIQSRLLDLAKWVELTSGSGLHAA